jgi:hypothetical protein
MPNGQKYKVWLKDREGRREESRLRRNPDEIAA